MTKQFRDFESAREFVQSLGLKGSKEWHEYCKSGKKPDDIPRDCNQHYKNKFKGMGDWLGAEFRSFTEARAFVQSLGLKSRTEWKKYCTSGNKPDDIPRSPNTTYKKDFKGVGDWLGTNTVASFNKQFRSFEEAREFVISLNLKNQKEWNEYCKSGNKPDDIPSSPKNNYKNDFKGYGDWLGTGTPSSRNRKFRSFEEAREFVQKLGLKNDNEWQEYCKSGNKPDDIPGHPGRIYKKDFKGLGDFLGTGNIAPYNKVYRPFKEAREFVRTLNLKGHKEWQEYCKSGNKPDDIPATPWEVYKEWEKK